MSDIITTDIPDNAWVQLPPLNPLELSALSAAITALAAYCQGGPVQMIAETEAMVIDIVGRVHGGDPRPLTMAVTKLLQHLDTLGTYYEKEEPR